MAVQTGNNRQQSNFFLKQIFSILLKIYSSMEGIIYD